MLVLYALRFALPLDILAEHSLHSAKLVFSSVTLEYFQTCCFLLVQRRKGGGCLLFSGCALLGGTRRRLGAASLHVGHK